MQKILFILLLVFFKVHVMSISQEFISVCLKDLSQYQNDVSVEKLFIARSQSRYRCYNSAQKRNKPADVIQRKPSFISLPFAPWCYSPLFDTPYRWLYHGPFHLKGPKQGNSPFFK